jgi:hypothetical protein
VRLLWLLIGCGFSQSSGTTESRCPHYNVFGAFYCDGFESGLNPDYFLLQVQAKVSIDDTRAYRGRHSLHLHTDAFDGINSYVDAEAGLDPSGPIIFGSAAALRVFLYLPSAIFDTLEGSFQLFSLGDVDVLDVNRFPALATQIADMAIPTNRWVCLEVRTEPADLGSAQTLLLDGRVVAQDSLSYLSNLLGFSLKLTRTGQAAPPLDSFYDELIIDDQPIGCDR